MQNAGWANRQWAPLSIELLLAYDASSVYVPYICTEAPCEGDYINRLGLTYLSGDKNLDASGILNHQDLTQIRVSQTSP